MRKTYLFFTAACLIAAAVLSEFGCSMRLGPVPNVMGSDYTAAKETLESAGYTVIAVEADAGNILSGTKWNRTVKKERCLRLTIPHVRITQIRKKCRKSAGEKSGFIMQWGTMFANNIR